MRAIRITETNWLNDEVGGDAGTVKMVRDEMAVEVVEIWHIAEYAPEYDAVPPPVAPQPAPAATEVLEIPATEPDIHFVGPEAAAEHLEQLQQTVAEFAGASGEGETLPERGELPADMKMPWTNASKSAWVEWAVFNGADPSEAAAQTKNDLMSTYGERL